MYEDLMVVNEDLHRSLGHVKPQVFHFRYPEHQELFDALCELDKLRIAGYVDQERLKAIIHKYTDGLKMVISKV